MSPTPARAARKADTRGRILDAARDHFERQGFEAAQVRHIAATAGVAAGTVLLHYPGKIALLHAALHDDLDAAIARSLAVPKRGRLPAQLTAIVRPLFGYYAKRPALSRTLLRQSLFADSPWRERFGEQFLRVHAHMVTRVQDAARRGEVASRVNAPLFVTAALAAYYFVLIAWVNGGVKDPVALFSTLVTRQIKDAAPR